MMPKTNGFKSMPKTGRRISLGAADQEQEDLHQLSLTKAPRLSGTVLHPHSRLRFAEGSLTMRVP